MTWADGHYVTDIGPQTEEFGRTSCGVQPGPDRGTGRHRHQHGGRDAGPDAGLAERSGALYVDHIGNAWDQPIGDTILWAVTNGGESGVTYHPEFHRVPWVPPTGNTIGSFHASFQGLHAPRCGPIWPRGTRSTAGSSTGPSRRSCGPHEVAQARSDCIAIWHCKDADGYGFGVHEAFASAVPSSGTPATTRARSRSRCSCPVPMPRT